MGLLFLNCFYQLRKVAFVQSNQRILLLLGPSGCGKTTLGQKLAEVGIPELVSHTTRTMRKGEIPGRSYHFVTPEELENIPMIESVCYAGKHYGISHEEVQSKLNEYSQVFATVDINGVRRMKEAFGALVTVCFIQADEAVLAARMRNRGDAEELIEQRLAYMKDHAEAENYRYADVVIDNTKSLDYAWEQLYQVVKRLPVAG